MKKVYLAIIPTGFLLLLMADIASAYIYHENYDTDSGGWTGGTIISHQTSGGVANSGYLRGQRVQFAPNYVPTSGNALANATGNLESLYGNRIEISYYGKIFQVQGPQDVGHLFSTTLGGGLTNWLNSSIADEAPLLIDWTKVTFEIDTNWTDAEAAANGWTRLSGSASWGNTLQNLSTMDPFYGWSDANTFASNIGGIDELRIATIPIPAAAWLFASGLVGLIGISRAKKVA